MKKTLSALIVGAAVAVPSLALAAPGDDIADKYFNKTNPTLTAQERAALAIAKARGQGRQHPVHVVCEQGLERRTVEVGLAQVLGVVRREFLVKRHVTGACGGGNAKAIKHVFARGAAQEPDQELDVSKPFALRWWQVIQ